MLEIAATIFAGMSAAAAAVQVWLVTREKDAAAQEFDKTFEKVRTSEEALIAAKQLLDFIPEEVIKDLESRADECWTGYRNVLGGEFLPDEIDNATNAVQACICRELGRLYVLGGSIPERWIEQWDRYKCAERVRISNISTS